MAWRWKSWSLSDVGGRAENEDAIVVRDHDGLWSVIDGNGHGAADLGKLASAALAHALLHLQFPESLSDSVDALEDTILAVNAQLLEFMSQQPDLTVSATIGTLHSQREWALFQWLGAVRLYRWRAGELTLLSRDHLDDDGVLSRSVGGAEPWPDLLLVAPQANDRYLLCSDGLHTVLSERRLAHGLQREPQRAIRELVAEALAAGASDNVSVVLVEVKADE